MSKIDIDYSAKPNKSLVRCRILNIIEEAFAPKHRDTEKLSYITFSGFRFVDSIAFYKRFNNRSIYSIEIDKRRFKRAKFNIPYSFVDIIEGRIADFIDEKYSKVISLNKVIWLDYESRFNDDVICDIEALFSSGFFDKTSLLFITFNSTLDRNALKGEALKVIPDTVKSKEAYKNWISGNFSDFILNKLQRKYKDKKCLKEVLKVFYRDTSNIVTIGYFIKDKEEGDEPLRKIQVEEFTLPDLTFLEENYIRNNLEGDPRVIADSLGLTEQEVVEYIKYC